MMRAGLVSRSMSEDEIMVAIADHINSRRVPGLIAFHVPNGGYRRMQEAVKFKRMGVLPGVSDWVLFYDRELYVLEVKADVGHPTEEQVEFMAAVERQGGHAACHRGLKACIHQLERWALLRGSMA